MKKYAICKQSYSLPHQGKNHTIVRIPAEWVIGNMNCSYIKVNSIVNYIYTCMQFFACLCDSFMSSVFILTVWTDGICFQRERERGRAALYKPRCNTSVSGRFDCVWWPWGSETLERSVPQIHEVINLTDRLYLSVSFSSCSQFLPTHINTRHKHISVLTSSVLSFSFIYLTVYVSSYVLFINHKQAFHVFQRSVLRVQ